MYGLLLPRVELDLSGPVRIGVRVQTRHLKDIARAVVVVLVCTSAMYALSQTSTGLADTSTVCTTKSDEYDVTFTTSYRVVNGVLGEVCVGQPDPRLEELWRKLTLVVPQHQRRHLSEFSAYESSQNRLQSASAFAQVTSYQPHGFRISINQESNLDEYYQWQVVVHEFGHVLTGRNDQRTFIGRYQKQCMTYLDGDRCYREKSLLNRWVEEFWTKEQIASLKARDVPYARKQRCATDAGFISSYAATSPGEDFSESFAAMVLGHRPANPQQKRKLQWLLNEPELREFWGLAQVNNVPQQQIAHHECGRG